jgi:hypothetical protein
MVEIDLFTMKREIERLRLRVMLRRKEKEEEEEERNKAVLYWKMFDSLGIFFATMLTWKKKSMSEQSRFCLGDSHFFLA